MKSHHLAALLALSTALVSTASAFSYRDTDFLLVFRKDGFDDVEFNLGSIDRFLNATNGESIVVNNWDLNLVKSTYDLNEDVKVLLIATSEFDSPSRRAWLTSAETNSIPFDRTPSQWQTLWSRINAVGAKPAEYTQTNGPATSFVASPTLFVSYTFVASGGGSAPSQVPKLAGASAFTIEHAIPATLDVYEIKPSTAVPKPPAKKLGQFTLDANGVLTFVAGTPLPQPEAPRIVHIARDGDTSAITFTTSAGQSYSLRYSEAFVAPLGTWPPVGPVVTGNGSDQTIGHTNSAGSGFYAVERNP